MMNKNNKGFTLIEILIALTVFAIMAAISSAALYDVFHTREMLNKQANQLNKLQLAYSLLSNDLQQVLPRPVRGYNMMMEPAFTANNKEITLTRDGLSNPMALEKRSTLMRIRLLCQKNQLIRESRPVLDAPGKTKFQQKVLLSHLKSCQFRLLTKNKQYIDEWRLSSSNQPGQEDVFPNGIELSLDLSDWEKTQLIFILPEALYHEKT